MALSIQGIGPGTCTFLLVFDNGYFSEFGTFSITDWLGHTPPEVLARNFGLPASTFANFPKKEVYIATGPVPPTLPQDPAPGSLNEPPLTHRYRLLAANENTRSDELEMVAVFNNGSYESISITGWMAANPDLLLSTNFGVPESVFAKFPKDAVIMPE
jgi:oxalate decarboxylase/phosphoglucose isomerase-like protein (cupin superfamily)